MINYNYLKKGKELEMEGSFYFNSTLSYNATIDLEIRVLMTRFIRVFLNNDDMTF